MKPLQLSGKPFGRLIVIQKLPRRDLRWPLRHEPNSFWRCRCSCGTLCIVRGSNLARGMTRSCGCYRRDFVAALNGRRWGNGEAAPSH